jgi:hypothetical protein
MYAHAQEPPPSVLAVAPLAPPELETVIKRGMAKEPDERYPSAGDLARAAAAAVERRDVSTSERSVAVGAAAPAARARRRRLSPVLAAAALVLVIGAAVAFALGRDGGGGGIATATATAVALSRDAYQDVMLDSFRPVTALIVEVEADIPETVDDPSKQVAAATALARIRTAMDKALATMRGITPPADVRDLHERLLGIIEQMRTDVANGVAAADFGNDRDYSAAGRALESDQKLLDPLAPEFRARGYSRLGQAE